MGALKDMQLPKGEKPELPPEGEVPEQRGEFKQTPWPGKAVLLLPQSFGGWSVIERKIREGDAEPVKRLEHTFDEDSPLTIMQHESGLFIGDTLRFVRISTMERARNKEKTLFVSDAFYLLRDAFEVPEAEIRKYADIKAWGAAIEKLAGKEFGADIEWSAYCNEKKAIRANVEGKVVEIPTTMGCKNKMYQKDIKAFAAVGESGQLEWPNMITCTQCEAALLYPNVQLSRFRAAKS